MKKTIKIDGKDVAFSTSLSWLFRYKAQFGKDPLIVFYPMIKSAMKALTASQGAEAAFLEAANGKEVDVLSMFTDVDIDEVMDPLYEIEGTEVLNIIWALASNADSEIDEPQRWYAQFETFPMDEIAKEVLPVIIQSVISQKKFKALKGLTGPKKKTQSSKSLPEASAEG